MRVTLVLIAILSVLSGNTRSIWQEGQSLKMNAEPLRIALSKIAPLEQWGISDSSVGPRVCWRLFRPSPQKVDQLLQVIRSFRGRTQWHLIADMGDCLFPYPGVGRLVLPAQEFPRTFPSSLPPPGVSEIRLSDDLKELAEQIENSLDLKNVQPKSFSKDLLTKEGLRRSREPFEDFEEKRERTVYLIVNPGRSGIIEPSEADMFLHFEPRYDEMEAILDDLIGAKLTQGKGRILSDPESEKIASMFPVFWKISDYFQDSYLSPQEAHLLLEECKALDKIVSSSGAIRGLDKISRIARWASEKSYGVLFEAP